METPVMDALLDHVEAFRYGDVADEVREYTCLIVLYTLGASLAAERAPVVAVARQAAAEQRANGGATVIGAGLRTTPILAAMVNGVACRFTELNDDYLGDAEVVHLNDVIPSALAVGEGRRLLRAFRPGGDHHRPRANRQAVRHVSFKDSGWHYTSGGLLTVLCLAGRLRGLDRDRLR